MIPAFLYRKFIEEEQSVAMAVSKYLKMPYVYYPILSLNIKIHHKNEIIL